MAPLFDNSGQGPLRVPNFGLPHDEESEDDNRFAHGVTDQWMQDRMTARELAMLGVMNALTEKPDWQLKVFDEAIVHKWHTEALAIPLISEKAWEWCLAELRDKAAICQATGQTLVLDGASRVCKSDTLATDSLRTSLIAATQPLLDRPPEERDWHPGSDDKVLNLVHPSLFPLVFGRTQVLAEGGKTTLDRFDSYGRTTLAPSPSASALRYSSKFQWLPCEVEFSDDSTTNVRITSYVNNLHPRHQALYATIEQVISLAIEPWNQVLVSRIEGRNPLRISTFGAQWDPEYPELIDEMAKIDKHKEQDPKVYAEALEKVKDYLTLPDVEGFDEERDLDTYDEIPIDDPRFIPQFGLASAVERKWERSRKVAHPDAGVAYSYPQWKEGKTGGSVVESSGWSRSTTHTYYDINIQDQFREQGLQVIVKLSGIELTPEKPSYDGGSWHLEGMLNEHIVATAIYYYDVENVTDSRISFRTGTSLDTMDLHYEQDRPEPVLEVFGVDKEDDYEDPEVTLQTLGSVSTPQGRLLAFPNTLQHKVEPFELVDSTKPGHRRFLVLWLVDPHYRICSTRNVPPQQHDWWASDGYNKIDFSAFPPEILEMVTKEVGEWPMGLEEAKELRLELMAERTQHVDDVLIDVESYNFCEH